MTDTPTQRQRRLPADLAGSVREHATDLRAADEALAAAVDAAERAAAREFEARMLMQMSANDSTNLIDTPAAANLGRHRAILHREELGTVEKFRTYAPFAT